MSGRPIKRTLRGGASGEQYADTGGFTDHIWRTCTGKAPESVESRLLWSKEPAA